MNNNKFIYILLFWFCTGYSFSQSSGFIVTEINSDVPEAEWMFSFVHITDLHIGESSLSSDFGTVGYLDTLTGLESGYCITALSEAVKRINNLADSLKIRFVIITGDMTDSGELSEFMKCKEILDSLSIPYIPLIGNHDIWPYTSSSAASSPIGDSLFNYIFETQFDTLTAFFEFWDDGTRLTRIYNPHADSYSYLQNFSFIYKDYYFLMCDFNARTPAPPGYPGVGPEAWLYDFTDGTFDWLTNRLTNYPFKGIKNILIFAHHPPVKDTFSFIYTFSQSEHNKITSLLCPYRESIGMWCAGHVHMDSSGVIEKWQNSDGIITQGFVTDANKAHTHGYFRVFKMWGPVLPYNNYLEKNNENGFAIFPNPANDYFNLSLQLKGTYNVEIFDLKGQMYYRNTYIVNNNPQIITLLTNKYPAGFYFVRIRNKINDSTTSKKLIILQ